MRVGKGRENVHDVILIRGRQLANICLPLRYRITHSRRLCQVGREIEQSHGHEFHKLRTRCARLRAFLLLTGRSGGCATRYRRMKCLKTGFRAVLRLMGCAGGLAGLVGLQALNACTRTGSDRGCFYGDERREAATWLKMAVPVRKRCQIYEPRIIGMNRFIDSSGKKAPHIDSILYRLIYRFVDG